MPGVPDDRIELRGLRVVGTHGVLVEEQERAQPFEVDLDLAVDLRPAGVSDSLADTVDYGAVADTVAATVSGPRSFALLEALAWHVADAVLDVKFVVLVHNTIRGAAGGALLNAEFLVAQKYLPQ